MRQLWEEWVLRKNVAEKTEEDRTTIGKLDHRERGGIIVRLRFGLWVVGDQEFLSKDRRAMDDIKL